ncbi:MAG: hypothetical protein AABZ47_02365 [Planctomycetota bacterium]
MPLAGWDVCFELAKVKSMDSAFVLDLADELRTFRELGAAALLKGIRTNPKLAFDLGDYLFSKYAAEGAPGTNGCEVFNPELQQHEKFELSA